MWLLILKKYQTYLKIAHSAVSNHYEKMNFKIIFVRNAKLALD